MAAYWPFKHEFDVCYILDDLLKRDITVAVPIVNKLNREMTFARWDGKSDFGIFVPPVIETVEPDIVIVPFAGLRPQGQ